MDVKVFVLSGRATLVRDVNDLLQSLVCGLCRGDFGRLTYTRFPRLLLFFTLTYMRIACRRNLGIAVFTRGR